MGRGRRFHRLHLAMFGGIPQYEALAGLRLAFDPQSSIPESKEAWIAEAKVRFASDEGFQFVIAEWEARLLSEATPTEPEPLAESSGTSGENAEGSGSSALGETVECGSSVGADCAGAGKGAGSEHKPVRQRLRSALRKLLRGLC